MLASFLPCDAFFAAACLFICMLGCSLLPAAAALLMATHTHASTFAVQVCRQADGFQKSLVSPEFGLKRLVSEGSGDCGRPGHLSCIQDPPGPH